MEEKLKTLEQQARELEIGPPERQQLRQEVIDYTEAFLEEIETLPAYEQSEEQGKPLSDSTISDKPTPVEEMIQEIEQHVDHEGLNPASGGHLGYIPGGGIYPSSLADFWAAITNRYAGVYFAGPGAVRLENRLLRWMAEMIGYPESAAGNLTSGGSIANLIGITTARHAMGIKARDFERSVIYMTEQVHHSVRKALRVAGLEEATVRYIPMDDQFRLDVEQLNIQIHQDQQEGFLPWLVVGSAGTTDTGAIDPISEIADLCRDHDLWFHLDAAYGGFFVLCKSGQSCLNAMHRADSIVMDPHKGLFLPYGCGALLVKERKYLYNAHQYSANYMQDAEQEGGELSPAELSPELTKHFRGLRLWLPLKYYGLAPFRSALEEKIQLARYFYREIQKTPRFEVGPEPELSVVIYRYVPEQGEPNKFNRQLVEIVQQSGRIFISSTTINGTVYLRLAVLSFRTHLKTIKILLKELKEKAAQIEQTRV